MLAGWLLEHFVRLNPGTTTLSARAVRQSLWCTAGCQPRCLLPPRC